MTTVKHALKHK